MFFVLGVFCFIETLEGLDSFGILLDKNESDEIESGLFILDFSTDLSVFIYYIPMFSVQDRHVDMSIRPSNSLVLLDFFRHRFYRFLQNFFWHFAFVLNV